MEFLSLATLMYGFHEKLLYPNKEMPGDFHRLTPSQVATAIEGHGCLGFDEYGRINEPNATISEKALKLVAEVHGLYLQTNFSCEEDCYRFNLFFEDYDDFQSYGWYDRGMPKFEDIPDVVQGASRQRGNSLNTQVSLLQTLLNLAGKDIHWLLEEAKFSDLTSKNAFNRLDEQLQLQGYKLKKTTLRDFLERLGVAVYPNGKITPK